MIHESCWLTSAPWSLALDMLHHRTCLQMESQSKESEWCFIWPPLKSCVSEVTHTCLHLPPGERRETHKTQEANEAFQCDTHKAFRWASHCKHLWEKGCWLRRSWLHCSGSTSDVASLASCPCWGWLFNEVDRCLWVTHTPWRYVCWTSASHYRTMCRSPHQGVTQYRDCFVPV